MKEHSWCLPQDRRDTEPGLLDSRRCSQDLVAEQAVVRLVSRTHTWHVGPEDVGQRQRMRGGRNTVQVQRLNIGGMVEDIGQLPGEAVQLGIGQVQARQAGHIGDIVTGDATGR